MTQISHFSKLQYVSRESYWAISEFITSVRYHSTSAARTCGSTAQYVLKCFYEVHSNPQSVQ